jgi:hypothetical protein
MFDATDFRQLPINTARLLSIDARGKPGRPANWSTSRAEVVSERPFFVAGSGIVFLSEGRP